MLSQGLTVELEYNYYNFASKDVSAIRTGDPADGAGVIDHWAVNPDIQTITARLNFKFN